MTKTARKIRISIFVKIFIAFMLVILLIYAFNIYLQVWGRNQRKQEMVQQTNATIHFFIDNLEKEFERIISTEAELIFDENLRRLTSDGSYTDPEIYSSINALNSRVDALRRSSSYIEEAAVYLLDRDLKVSSLINREINKEEWERVTDSAFLNGFPIICYRDDFYINLHSQYYQKTLQNTSALKYVISVRLNAQKLMQDLNKLSDIGHVAFINLGHGLDINGHSLTSQTALQELQKVPLPNKQPYSGTLSAIRPRVYYTVEKSDRLNTMVLLYAEEALFSSLKIYDHWLFASTALFALVFLLFILWIRHIITVPLDKLIAAIKRGLNGDMKVHVQFNQDDEYGYLYNQFNEMMETHSRLVNEIYLQQMLVKDAQLKQLQYQINPHFLYNSFFILHRMTQAGEYEDLSKMLLNLSNYYRVVTKDDSLLGSLRQEFNHSHNYLEIQSIRFAGRILVEWDPIPPVCNDLQAPRFILQPIFENCYNHGLKNKEYSGLIRCRISAGSDISISIEDNGDELSDETVGALNGKAAQDRPADLSGLMNVNQRLKLAYGSAYGLVFARSGLGGLCVTLRIPVHTPEEAPNV